ncbi:MAG TPA: DUF5715 family protein [Acidobacteriaceae bacterium]|jgi:hypothetical protein
MRSRFSFVAAAGLALALPLFAGTPAHHRHRASLRAAAASPCGRIAGHSRHTLLTTPASVSCRANAAPVLHVQTRPAHLSTRPVQTHAAIASLARVRFVPPLRGSLASLVRQNRRDEAEGLTRIEDDAQLTQLEASGDIVPLPAGFSLRVNPDLPANRRYARAWTARFLTDLGRSHYARFHRELQVNSAVRTVAFQRSLIAINGNAAPADGDIASPHLTGAAVDIGKKGMSFSELSWMRAWLLPLQTAGKIDVEEEFYQSCFHITVYRGYSSQPLSNPAPPRMIAHRRHSTTTLLAAGVR